MIQGGAVVLMSGGQDSTTSLVWAQKNISGPITGLFIDYGQRHISEINSSMAVAKNRGILLKVMEMTTPPADSALTDASMDISDQHNKDVSLPASFVPGRNILLITYAAIHAYQLDLMNIVTGVCQLDFQGYPDCRATTIGALQAAISVGMKRDIFIHTPLMFKTKAESIKMMQEYGALDLLALTTSCYNGQHPPCGSCPSCKVRAAGFANAGVVDPLLEKAE